MPKQQKIEMALVCTYIALQSETNFLPFMAALLHLIFRPRQRYLLSYECPRAKP
jgi:hypothetical protein